ncbi:hypothetical protein DAI22_12g164100 [Oryza sativa Japonica Group]|nr:hypothetical protein DAI22_12g164100 [Oryza sativa Japonica Group]
MDRIPYFTGPKSHDFNRTTRWPARRRPPATGAPAPSVHRHCCTELLLRPAAMELYLRLRAELPIVRALQAAARSGGAAGRRERAATRSI